VSARIKIVVHGVVQGVGFRYYTYRIANKLTLHGYVTNKKDGTVEVVAEGEKSKLLRLVEELRIGPPGSSVQNFHLRWEDPKDDFKEFKILR
jgi:acylphosphatase